MCIWTQTPRYWIDLMIQVLTAHCIDCVTASGIPLRAPQIAVLLTTCKWCSGRLNVHLSHWLFVCSCTATLRPRTMVVPPTAPPRTAPPRTASCPIALPLTTATAMAVKEVMPEATRFPRSTTLRAIELSVECRSGYDQWLYISKCMRRSDHLIIETNPVPICVLFIAFHSFCWQHSDIVLYCMYWFQHFYWFCSLIANTNDLYDFNDIVIHLIPFLANIQ